ncbi:MAG: hypothetical protein JSR58_05535 [Verrucomicrobia bacterium]|nr:hypothetical protein [Verrucomicrobiota bacterium]
MKTFVRSALGLVVLLFIGALIILFVMWSRVPDLLAGSLSKKLKVVVEIGDIDLSLKNIDIEKLEIGNPRGYSLPRAFAVDRIAIEAPLTRYLKNHIVIDEINLDNVYLGLEFNSPTGTEGNWTTIMHNAKASQESSGKTSKTVLIHRIVLNNIQTDLLYRGGKVRRLPVIKRMELNEVSSEGGSLSDQLMNSALGEMIKQVFIKQNLQDILDKVLSPGQGGSPVEQAIKQFRGFLNTIPDLTTSE